MTIVNDAEVLHHEPEPWRPGRTTRIVSVAILILAVIAVLVDREARADETEALSACSEEIEEAIGAALGPVDSMVAYVRSTRDGASATLSRSLEALVAERTANASADLEPAVTACEQIQVLRHHGQLGQRKQNCLHRLDLAEDFLARVARDGGVAFGPRGSMLPAEGC